VALDPPSLATMRVLWAHAYSMKSMCTAADGRLVTSGSDGRVRVWSRGGGVVEAELVADGAHTAYAMCALTDGSNRVVTGRSDAAARLYDLSAARDGAQLAPIREYRGHTSSVVSMAAMSGGRLATGSMDDTVRVWDVESGACLATLHAGVECTVSAMVVMDEDTLVCNSPGRTIGVWDTRSYTRIATIKVPSYPRGLLRLADGTLASGHYNGVVRLWDVRRLQCVGELRGPTCEVCNLAQLGDGRLIGVARDQTAALWDVAARTCVGVLRARNNLERCCATSDGGVAVGCNGGSVTLLGIVWARRGVAVVGWVAAWAGVWS